MGWLREGPQQPTWVIRLTNDVIEVKWSIHYFSFKAVSSICFFRKLFIIFLFFVFLIIRFLLTCDMKVLQCPKFVIKRTLLHINYLLSDKLNLSHLGNNIQIKSIFLLTFLLLTLIKWSVWAKHNQKEKTTLTLNMAKRMKYLFYIQYFKLFFSLSSIEKLNPCFEAVFV